MLLEFPMDYTGRDALPAAAAKCGLHVVAIRNQVRDCDWDTPVRVPSTPRRSCTRLAFAFHTRDAALAKHCASRRDDRTSRVGSALHVSTQE
jgi:hypothetical protein